MNWCETCAVVVPCCNEQADIARLVRAVRRYLPLVLVVDDNSRDQTSARAAEAGALTIRRTADPGKGAAIKTGAAAALMRGCGWVISLDADGQHRPDDIPAFLHCAEEKGAKLVVGNRMHQADAVPWLRRQVNRWMSQRISKLAGRVLPDSQCGFRLINLAAWSALRLETDHFEIESEMLLAFVQAGYRAEFVPIQVVAASRRSHIRLVKDTWRWMRWWRRARLARLAASQLEGGVIEHSACAGASAGHVTEHGNASP